MGNGHSERRGGRPKERRGRFQSRLVTAIGLFAGVLLAEADASAYCRITTCDVKSGAACERNERGCVREGAPLRWEEMPIRYRFHERGSTLLDREESRLAIRASFQRWADVICPNGRRTSLRFEEEEDTPFDKPLEIGAQARDRFAIFFRDDAWPYEGDDHTLALTNHGYGTRRGVIDYADIEINTTVGGFSTSDAAKGTDLQAVVTHEVGHYIGLAHSDAPDSIMVAEHCRSQERCANGKVDARRLSDDDEMAVCVLYPPEGESLVSNDVEAPRTTAACTATPARTKSVGTAAIALAVLLGLALRTRRQR